MEWEIKLLTSQALDLDRLVQAIRDHGVEVEPGGEGRQVDTYLDTARMDLCRIGGGLRVRDKGDAREINYKAKGRRKGAIHQRQELEETWSRAGLPRAARALPGGIRREVEPHTYARGLRELARIENLRRRFLLRHAESGAVAEMVVDRVQTHAGRASPGVFDEIEIESLEGSRKPWLPLADALRPEFGLEVSTKSKLQRALDVAEITPRKARRSFRLTRSMPFAEAAYEIFRKHFRRLQLNEPGTRLAEDIEALHDMRVSSRRLRASFRLLAGAFPPGRLELPAALMRETGQVLGHARDLDVFIEALPELRQEMPARMVADLNPFEELIIGYRSGEQRRILRWMQAPRRLRAFEDFQAFLEEGPSETSPLGIMTGHIAPGLILSAARRVYRRGSRIKRSSPPERLHRLRIAMKKMRYAMEDFADLYGEDLNDYVLGCKKLQDVLGAVNDAEVMSSWLGSFVQEHGEALPKSSLLAVGCLVGTLHARSDAARAGYRKAWKVFGSEELREELNHALAESL